MFRFPLAATLVSSLIVLAPLASAHAAMWTVDKGKSTLSFEVKQGDSPIKGTFKTWDATIDFDPTNPDDAKIEASIATASVATGSAQYDDMLPKTDWFDSEVVPDATFTAEDVKALGDGKYSAEGTLQIKDIAEPVTLEFSLTIDGNTAHAVGTAHLKRSTYHLGQSVPASTLPDDVTVSLDLTATAQE